MNFQEILNDKSVKPKEKTEMLSQLVLNNPNILDDLIAFAKTSKDPIKATVIESFEFATKSKAEIATKSLLQFVSQTLTEKAPRVKWESAKVIGNIAHLFPKQLDEAIKNLLVNTEHTGTVVRWSAAFALSEIIKLKTAINTELIPAVESIIEREEKNSIKKIYLEGLKKVKK
jgi:HEAT repeat protein